MKSLLLLIIISLPMVCLSAEKTSQKTEELKKTLSQGQDFVSAHISPYHKVSFNYVGNNFYTGLYDILSTGDVNHFLMEMDLKAPQECKYLCTVKNYISCGYLDIRFCKIIQGSIQRMPLKCRLPGKYIENWSLLKRNIVYNPIDFQKCKEVK